MYEKLTESAGAAVKELICACGLKKGDLVVVGFSTSEVLGQKIGSGSSPEAGAALFEAIFQPLRQNGVFLAAQCCEHLNRSLIVEREYAVAHSLEMVNVVPVPKAGGSFATAAYAAFSDPVAVEQVQADAGLDVGDTLIGMHLKKVAVPVRLSVKKIGEANVVAARTRLKFVGGSRAHYDESAL